MIKYLDTECIHTIPKNAQERTNKMRAVMTVTGKDIIGILAEVSGKCSELNVNITEVTQSVLQDLFCMIMLVDTEKCSVPLSEFSDIMSRLGQDRGLDIHVMHEAVFDSMYHV